MNIKLYWGSGSPYAWRVMLALEFKKLTYESIRLSFSESDLKSKEFLAINPRGQVPALVDGDFKLYESLAILAYLEDIRPEPALFGGDPQEHALIWCSVMECVYHWEPHMTSYAGNIFSGKLPEKSEETIRSREKLEQELTGLNKLLSSAEYLVGSRLSAADISLYPVLQLFIRAAKKENTAAVSGNLLAIRDNYPAVGAWFERIEAIPGYERTYPPHWK
jgi:glutathione S-transferase